MHIIFSCAGEGFGHITRIVALADRLHGTCQMSMFCPESLHDFARARLPHIPLYPVPCFSFAKRVERIDYATTVAINLPNMIRFRAHVSRLTRTLADLNATGVVCDFEPHIAYAARRLSLPILHLTHPTIVFRTASARPDAIIAKMVSRLLAAHYDSMLICSFYDGDIGPIIQRSLRQRSPKQGDKLVLYLKPTYRRKVVSILHTLGVSNFDIFPNPHKDYITSLIECRGVISSAGHQFISEAIILNKPALVIPQEGQYEQRLNAKMLRYSGRGDWCTMRRLKPVLAKFLNNIDTYPRPPHGNHHFILQDDTDGAVARILRFFDRQ